MKRKNIHTAQWVRPGLALALLLASATSANNVEATQRTNQIQDQINELTTRFKNSCINTSIITELSLLVDTQQRLTLAQACDEKKWEKAVTDIVDRNYVENSDNDANFRENTRTGTYFLKRVVGSKKPAKEQVQPERIMTSISSNNDNGSQPTLEQLDNYTTLGN